jgi:hypothetical protein
MQNIGIGTVALLLSGHTDALHGILQLYSSETVSKLQCNIGTDHAFTADGLAHLFAAFAASPCCTQVPKIPWTKSLHLDSMTPTLITDAMFNFRCNVQLQYHLQTTSTYRKTLHVVAVLKDFCIFIWGGEWHAVA